MDETAVVRVLKYSDGTGIESDDAIVREEPLEIFINGQKKYFCMRMPGMDYELALGLMYNEGLINSVSDVKEYNAHDGSLYFSIDRDVVTGFRKIYSSSGSMFSDDLVIPVTRSDMKISTARLFTLQEQFFKMQRVFEMTGGVHACAFYSSPGGLISFAEDVGRHNALDKCMGRSLALSAEGKISLILLSSRISFEMIRKSYRTGATLVAGVSAPTSAAVHAALQSGVTLIGFLRGERFNIYSHPDRVFDSE